METQSSAKRITRSHAFAANDQKGVSKSMQKSGKKQQDRSALFDITNDSPIVGLALGNLSTPSSGFSKKRSVISSQCSNNTIGITTPGSGEALLRSQVKSLLQKVKEEGEILKFSLEDVGGPFVHLKGLFANSPMALLAPTPTNTPSVIGTQSTEKIGFVSGISTPVLEQVSITKMVTEIIDRQKKKEDSLITRSLLFDFYEKSEVSPNSSDCVSTMTSQGGSVESKAKFYTDDGDNDNASIWSLQVNASSKDEDGDDDVEEVGSGNYTYDYKGEGEDFDDDAASYDICEGLSKISVNGPKFSGKHTRFVYNIDEDLAAQEEDSDVADSPPGVLHLKGLPTPKGKHLRFHLED